MTPDSPEAYREAIQRVGTLEREMSAIQTRVGSLAHDVELLAPVQMSVIEIKGQVAQVKDQLVGLREALVNDRDAAQRRGQEMQVETKELRQELADMRDTQSADAKAMRRLLIVSATSIITTVLLVGGTLGAALIG